MFRLGWTLQRICIFGTFSRRIKWNDTWSTSCCCFSHDRLACVACSHSRGQCGWLISHRSFRLVTWRFNFVFRSDMSPWITKDLLPSKMHGFTYDSIAYVSLSLPVLALCHPMIRDSDISPILVVRKTDTPLPDMRDPPDAYSYILPSSFHCHAL